VALGMLVIYLTGWHIFDPIFAIIVALFIMEESFNLVSNAFSPLLDSQINDEEYQDLFDKIRSMTTELNLKFGNLRSRKNGSKHLIDFVLYVPPQMTVEKSLQMSDFLEENIQKYFLYTEIAIHVEPFSKKTTLPVSE
jgi:divalent metal cation (Fe/Co/Zn/Cd) transporter